MRILICFCIYCLWFSTVLSQEPTFGSLFNEQEPSVDVPDKSWAFSGFGEFDHFSFLRYRKGKSNYRFQAILNAALSARLDDQTQLYGTIEFRNDLADSERNRVFVDEFYLDYRLDKMEFRLGRQFVEWGEADGINPTNRFNATDFSDLFDFEDEELPAFAWRTRFYHKRSTFDLIVTPIFVPSRLPVSERSRWRPELPALLPHPAKEPPALIRASYSYEPYDLANSFRLRDDWQAGLRWSLQLDRADVSMSYFNGLNTIPRYASSFELIQPDSLLIRLDPQYYRWQMIGHDFSTVLGDFGLRGEGALIISDSPGEGLSKDPVFYHYVLGIDRLFSDLIGDNNLFLILQWSHEWIIEGGSFPTNDIIHIFQRAVLLRLEQEIGPHAKLHCQGVYDFLGKSFYIQPKLSWNIRDGLNMQLLADLLGGRTEAFFGQYRQNDRIQCRVKYNF